MRAALSRSVGALVFGAAALVACGGSVAVAPADGGAPPADGGARDAAFDASPVDASPVDASPVDAGDFCSGPAPRLTIDGAETEVLWTKGRAIPMDCCDAAEVTVAGGAFASLMYFMWRVQGGSPEKLDLARLPPGATVELAIGCDPAEGDCSTRGAARYTSGFTGHVEPRWDGSTLEVGYCVTLVDPAPGPGSPFRTMQLYVPRTATSN